MTVAITRLAMSAAELREYGSTDAGCESGASDAGDWLVLEGWSREAAAEACAMDRQTLRDWVHRYNELGPEGLFASAAPQRAAAPLVGRAAGQSGGMGRAGSEP